MANGTVATGTPVTRTIPAKAKGVTVSVSAIGGTIDVDWFVDSDLTNGIAVPWSAGQIADAGIDARTFMGSLESFRVTGDGKFNYRVLY